jgi:hypothetical protein
MYAYITKQGIIAVMKIMGKDIVVEEESGGIYLIII